MTDYQAWIDKQKEASDSLQKAKEALTAGDAQVGEWWAKKAQEQFASLAGEVKDGNNVIVNAAQATQTAVNGVRDAGQVLDDAIAKQQGAAEATRQTWAAQMETAKGDLAAIQEMKSKVEQIDITMTTHDHSTEVLDNIKQLVDSIHDKTITITTLS